MEDHKFNWRLQSSMKLGERCLECIAQMLLNIKTKIKFIELCSDFNLDIEDSRNNWLSEVKNVFFDVPRSIIPDIISMMAAIATRESNEPEKLKIDKDVLSVLLCKPVQRLEIRVDAIETKDMDGVFEMIKQTKSQITTLKFRPSEWVENFPDCSFPNLEIHLRDMPSLTHLEIEKLNCDDSLLETVGASCPNLRYLRVSSSLFTNTGLKSLCLDPKDLTTKRCQKLESLILDVGPPKSITEGLAALLLNLPQLSILEYEGVEMSEAFRVAYDNDQQLKIQGVTYTSDFCELLNPTHLPDLFPHLTTLHLGPISSQVHRSFPAIPTLREMTFYLITIKPDFDDRVVPVLQKNGKFLEVLTFGTSLYLNYTDIDQLCINLKKLYIENFESLDGTVSTEPHFLKLETLYLHAIDSEPAAQHMQLISNCHNLRHLTILWSTWKIDHLVDVISQNPFHKLLSVDIQSDFMCIEGKTSDAATTLSPFLQTLYKK